MPRRQLMEIIAEKILSPNERSYILKRVDIIGDIAIIKIHPYLLSKRFLIGEALLKELPNIRAVFRQVSPTSGQYRTRELEWLAGEKRSYTVVKEFGCTFKVDIKKVFYTPRLSYEHMRVAKLVRKGEVVINMFAGIGPFSIIIAKHAEPQVVYSIDVNPYAYNFMKENIQLNKVENLVIPILGDAAEVIIEMLVNVADRVLMPLPSLALKYLPFAILGLKPRGGYIHLYLNTFVPRDIKPHLRVIRLCSKALSSLSVPFKILSCRRVRSIGPRRVLMVLDVMIKRGVKAEKLLF